MMDYPVQNIDDMIERLNRYSGEYRSPGVYRHGVFGSLIHDKQRKNSDVDKICLFAEGVTSSYS